MQLIVRQHNIIRYLCSLLCLAMQVSTLLAQTIITGTISDKNTGETLPNANIYIQHSRWGTTSNSKGAFSFVLPQVINPTDSVCFSFIGYNIKCVGVSNISEQNWNIQLENQSFPISEIIIKANTAEKIITEALAAIPRNYTTKPIQMKGFYRETVSDNGAFTEFLEAVVEINKESYISRKSDDLMILKGRELKNLSESPIWKFIYFVDGPHEALLSDFAKNPNHFISIPQSSINFLNPKNFKHYTYKLHDAYTDVPYYTIQFKPKTKRATYEGYLYIDKKTFAFLSLYYTLAPDKLEYVQLLRTETLDFLNTQDIYTLPVDYFCLVNFEKWNDKYYLNYSKMGYQFLMISNKHKIFSHISNSQQLFITETDTVNYIEFPWYKTLRRNQKLSTQMGEFDSTFWNNYQVIEMDEWEKVRLRHLVKKKENRKK